MQISESDYFAKIQLQEMDKVKLMNRRDIKYWFHTEHLSALIQTVKDNYFILNINGKAELPYSTTYYDTSTNNMFAAHHKGKLNRFKVRRRSYVSSGISFLEVKFKNNKGRTIKKRISSNFGAILFIKTKKDFLSSQVPARGKYRHSKLGYLRTNDPQLLLVRQSRKQPINLDSVGQ